MKIRLVGTTGVARKLERVGWALLLLLFLAGCLGQQDYYPLSEGYQWEYSVTSGDMEGGRVIRINGKEAIAGKDYYRKAYFNSRSAKRPQYVIYQRKTKKGIYTISEIDKPEYLSVAFPLRVGRRWTIEREDEIIQYSVESVETVTVSNQRYDSCLKLSYVGKHPLQSYGGDVYLAPGIGMVKRFHRVSTQFGSTTERWILTNYKK